MTGLFASALINPAVTRSPANQLSVQAIAAFTAAAYAFAVSLVLAWVIDKAWGFTLEPRAENEGIDRSEHGEVGFDLGTALETVPAQRPPEPLPAQVPPNGKRHFTVVVEGAAPRTLIGAWSNLCGGSGLPPTAEFRSIYPYVTTVQGNRFHFRGGDPIQMRQRMQQLFQNCLEGTAIQTHVES
jgi:hypothetical protein